MSRNTWVVFWAGVGVVLILLGAITGALEQNRAEKTLREFREEAVANGAAFYHPQTKEFTWVKREPVKITQKRIVQTSDGKMWVESSDGEREPYEHGDQ